MLTFDFKPKTNYYFPFSYRKKSFQNSCQRIGNYRICILRFETSSVNFAIIDRFKIMPQEIRYKKQHKDRRQLFQYIQRNEQAGSEKRDEDFGKVTFILQISYLDNYSNFGNITQILLPPLSAEFESDFIQLKSIYFDSTLQSQIPVRKVPPQNPDGGTPLELCFKALLR
ncbi:MAG: hypothetical protein EZS28_034051 [Streblomastix strix]|uniref:Uncharacterized protein n=1 Tax=Streblomastix strix TaxID=222440 RepID=A0A5J4UJK8_9EUKA|nr:MAG: hypothetical protein EZS28_034051 [Streblomastix strix]